ncbi:MAG: MazG-like family protein, partial [Candidatus Yanofskybacteria bacterium]|nr:MazG-like family protein [Candidatus Yanofskybacteria bacterium]
HFQWKNSKVIADHIHKNRSDIGEELADVLYWVLLMSHDLKIDINKALKKKLEVNHKKYPVEKAKGRHTKYNKL